MVPIVLLFLHLGAQLWGSQEWARGTPGPCVHVYACVLPTMPVSCPCRMLTLQVPGTKVMTLRVWVGSSGLGSRHYPAHVALAAGANPGLWASEAEAAEVETAPTWVQLLLPHASSVGGHPSPKVLPPALWTESRLPLGRPRVTYKAHATPLGLPGTHPLVRQAFLSL